LNNPKLKKSGIPVQPLPGRAANTVAPATETADDGTVASFGSEVKSLLDGFLETIIKSAGAKAGAIRLLSSNGRELHIAGAVGLPPEIFEHEGNIELDCGVCGKAASGGDIQSDEMSSCAKRFGTRFFGEDCRRIVAVPLEYRDDPIGVFNLFYESGQEIAADSTALLRSFAEMIGIALENARLSRENRRMNLMAERQAIANEIHDSLAQDLAYSRMRMSVLQEAVRTQDELLAHKCMRDINEALDTGQKSVRELITHFRCQMDPLGLQHALQVLVNEFGERTGIALEYSNRVPDPGLPLEHELQVFHIVREVLANIATHSGASHAVMQVTRKSGRYVFTIEDDGMGMSSSTSPEGHYGLTIMRERALRIGAEIEVESMAGYGTRVRLSLAVP
jgi:two-component system, NarL family, nitrate/nitrite sensor histidine kinase NarX